MNKPIVLFYFLAASILHFPATAQSTINQACEKLAKASFEYSFDLASIEESKELLYDATKASAQDDFNSCNCNDSLYYLLARDNRRFGPIKKTHAAPPIGLDTSHYLQQIVQEVDLLFLNKELSYNNLNTPFDTIQYILEKLKGMALEPNEKKVRHYSGSILSEHYMIESYKEELIEEYFFLVKDDSIEPYLKDRLLVPLFTPKVKNQKMDSLTADIISLEHPLFYRMCGLLRIYGGPHSTQKIKKLASTGQMDSLQKEFLISLPISYYRQDLISKKEMRSYGKFIFENNLYPWCIKGDLKNLGEKNEKAFRRRYRKYL